MQRMVFINLPVADVTVARDFYTGLGFAINETFSDANTASVMIEENIVIMLLTKPRFADFVNGEIADAHTSTEVLVALSASSRDEVDDLHRKALAGGGKPWREPQDLGFMYGQSFTDPDGHVLEVVWMDQAAAQAGLPAQSNEPNSA